MLKKTGQKLPPVQHPSLLLLQLIKYDHLEMICIGFVHHCCHADSSLWFCLQMPRDWEELRLTVIRPGPIPTSSPCGNTIPDDDRLVVSLPAGARSVRPSLTQSHEAASSRLSAGGNKLCCLAGLWCRLTPCVWKEGWRTRFASSSRAIKTPTPSWTEEPKFSSSSILWDQVFSVCIRFTLLYLFNCFFKFYFTERLSSSWHWCHVTPPWRCSTQGTPPLTSGSRPLSGTGATRGQRVWSAHKWVTPAPS